MKDLRQIVGIAAENRDSDHALATLVRTEGSSYRQPGARMLVAADGQTTGFLSGGCLEEEIGRLGKEVIRSGSPWLGSFDTRQLYGCNGRLEIYIEKVPAAGTEGNFLTELAGRFRSREVCRISVPYEDGGPSSILPGHSLVPEREGVFLQTLPLPVRLILFGSGPEIAPIRWFAAGLGWDIADFHHPDELPQSFHADSATAAVIMTHKFGRDLAALDRLLPLGLPYIGLLGPKKRQLEILARFQDLRDLDPAWLA
ncbi:MAG: hypothetical protein EOP87_10940, partial [Verrucomicrobiaceae bacterium]